MNDERYEIIEDDEKAQMLINKSMLYADAFVNKNYLINLNCYPVVPLENELRSDRFIRLYKISQIVYDVDEISNDKMISIYSALSNIEAAALLVIQSTAVGVDFYIGVRSTDNASTAGMILQKSFKGNFPGSKMENISNSKIEEILGNIVEESAYGTKKSVAAVSIVPSERDDDKNNFVQGIEKFIDTMQGEEYTAVFISTPLNKSILEQRKRGLLNLYANMSSFAKIQMSYGENVSTSVANSMSENLSESLNDSLTDTTSSFESRANTKSRGSNIGHSFGLFGTGFSHGVNRSESNTYSAGNSWAKAVSRGSTKTTGTTTGKTDTESTGSSKTMTVTFENKSVQDIMEKIEKHLERIKECEAFGLWDAACYFIADDIQTAVVASNTYKALMAGNSSCVENSFINIWNRDKDENTDKVLDYMRFGIHPQVLIPSDDTGFFIDNKIVTPTSMISGNEMPVIMGMPRKSVSGVTVLNMAEFGRNVYLQNQNSERKRIDFGYVYHMSEIEKRRVKLDLESFRSHCFITGSTGSGKSNTTYKIIDEMIKNGITFMVIEPAKGEYKRYYGGLEGINIFCTNPSFFSMLKINPFKFNAQIHILEHLDRLIEIISACWPLYAAMPAILKESFEQAYIKCGWDLSTSIYFPNGHSKYPTFKDVLEILPEVINGSEYSAESKGNYIGSLVTRVKSLTNGILGQIMCDFTDIDDSTLFDENTIIDLSRISSLETKSLIMGILILKLNEHRMGSGMENVPLKHITIMEEAHNILKRTSGGSSSAESADVMGKSVEMISSSIAEMRTYGEGFIIVDQSPTSVDVSAIKNTNTKIIMRLPDYDDCQIAGKAIGLTESQINEISKLPMGVAVVYQNNWMEAVLTKIDKSEKIYHQDDIVCHQDEIAEVKGQIVPMLVECFELGLFDSYEFDIQDFINIVNTSNLTKYKKTEIITKIIDFTEQYSKETPNNKNFSENLMSFIGCRGMFDIFDFKLSKDYSYLSDKKITRSLISAKDGKNARRWYNNIMKALDEYALIEERDVKERVIRYLIYHMRNETAKYNKYHIYYTCLY